MKLLIIFLSIVLFLGCGYFDNDKIIIDKEVYGKFKIQHQQNSSETSLVYQESGNVGSVLVQDCQRILFDSRNKIIYTESILNKFNNDYRQIQILSESGSNIRPYRIQAIEKVVFDSLSLDSSKVYFVSSSK